MRNDSLRLFEEMPLERIREDRLELAACTLVNKQTRSATFIAMNHALSPMFYQKVEALIASKPGIVLSEGARFDEASRDSLEGDMRTLYDYIWGRARMFVRQTQDMGLDIAYQRDMLRLPSDRTVNSDLSLEEWVRELRTGGFDFSELEEKVQTNKDHWAKNPAIADTPKDLLDRYARMIDADIMEIHPPTQVSPSDNMSIFDDVIDTVRENIVLRNIARLTRETDVIVPWGIIHTRMMISTLLESEEWSLGAEPLHYLPAYRRRYPKEQ